MGDLSKVRVFKHGANWGVWVPPVHPEAFEVPDDPDSALCGPYGDSYWLSFDNARRFAVDVLAMFARRQED